jgi:plasmid stabilization system protein ParE
MAFRVELSTFAERDIEESFAYIAKDSPVRARQWLSGLFATLFELADLPAQHSVIPEAEKLGRPLRSVNYHSHRIIYEARESEAILYIVRVYHGARWPLQQRDLGH